MNTQTSITWSGLFSLVTPKPAATGRRAQDLVARVQSQCQRIRDVATPELHRRTDELRRHWPTAICTDPGIERTSTAFALVNEAFRRVLGVEFYDVQLHAGHALSQGRIAEMATGEGKTFVQALAAFSYALAGQGVHVMTSNAYLAERDCVQLAPALERLGMRVGLLAAHASAAEKAQAYAADITFGPGYDFGFDYLRDQLLGRRVGADRLGESLHAMFSGINDTGSVRVQRGHPVAIIDEIDSVLIDEATTPLVLSAEPEQNSSSDDAYLLAAQVAAELRESTDYVLDESERRMQLTRGGVRHVLAQLRRNTDLALQRAWPVYVEQALFARHMLRKDVDYIVNNGKVLLVDQSTGRVFADRTLRDGLHQAVESKEGVPVSQARATLGRISRQQYFQLYERKCGMTGTATGSEREFWHLFQLPITRVPTRKTCRRAVLPTRFFSTKQKKRMAIVADIEQRIRMGQPVLLGTQTIDESHVLTNILQQRNIPHQLLNGVQDATEADIIQRAGRAGAVTVATNIAGRGTDIRLGPAVPESGGLHVIASEPHESSRVDRQLTGRCARQGDPGSCQMFVSAEDTLLKTHGQRLATRLQKTATASGESHSDYSYQLRRVQQSVEQLRFEQRRDMLAQDSWMEEVMAKLAE